MSPADILKQQQLNADLLVFQAAYKELLLGQKSTKLVVGTGSSRREYGYQEINESLLLAEIGKIKAELLALEPVEAFRTVVHRITWSKR